jgi:hypothetical protein
MLGSPFGFGILVVPHVALFFLLFPTFTADYSPPPTIPPTAYDKR